MSKTKSNTGSDLPPTKKHHTDASIFQDALYEAAKFGSKEKVQSLLSRGAKVHIGKSKDSYYCECIHDCEIETPMEEAVKANHHEIMLILLKHLDKRKVNLECMLKRLLLLAAQFAGNDIVIELIRMGAEMNPKHNDYYPMKQNETPLQVAIKNQNLEVVRVLLANGSDPNSFPVLNQALETGNLKIIQMLLENGANGNYLFDEALFAYSNSLATIEMLLKCDVDVNIRDDSNWTPLHRTIANTSNVGLASLLIRFGADINAKDNYLQTPLHFAYAHIYGYENLEFLKILMQNGANPNLKDDEGESAIEYFLEGGASAVEHFKVILYNQCHF